MLPIPIDTPRLVLRRLATGDWRDLLEILSDEETFRYMEGAPLDEERILHWLESDFHVKLTTPDQVFYLGMELKEGGKLVGYLGVNFTDPQRLQVNFHICIGRNHQRKGLAREAVEALLGFCFKAIKLHRVAASSDARNVAACHLLEQAGLRREGEFVKNKLTAEGEWANTACYAILAEEHGQARNS
jgi:RimJ/RimL family protein N-acetyltransferase